MAVRTAETAKETFIWAHRGSSHDAPENTLEAFELAIRHRADGIELDVHLSADGEVIVFHDDTVDRVTDGTGEIEAMTLAEIKKLDASACHPRYAGARVPTLKEVYELVKPSGLRLNIELKETFTQKPELAHQVLQLAKDFDMQGRVMYCSFNHYSLQYIKSVSPGSVTGLLYHAAMIQPWQYARLAGADCLHPWYTWLLGDDTVRQAHTHGIVVNTWTVDNPEHMQQLYALGVDSIITNRPDVALRERESYTNRR